MLLPIYRHKNYLIYKMQGPFNDVTLKIKKIDKLFWYFKQSSPTNNFSYILKNKYVSN